MLEQKRKYSDIPQRASLFPQYAARTPATNKPIPDDLEEDASYYPVRPSSSAIRYTTTQGQQVIQQGNKRIIIHHEPPPGKQPLPPEPVTKSRHHWLFWLGSIFCMMLVGWILLTALSGWIQERRNDLMYGNPRTTQLDANFHQNNEPSHIIAINLNGTIEIIATQTGKNPALHMYVVATLPTSDGLEPIILTVQDLNGDGNLDLLVTIKGFTIPLYNNGTGFQPQPPTH